MPQTSRLQPKKMQSYFTENKVVQRRLELGFAQLARRISLHSEELTFQK